MTLRWRPSRATDLCHRLQHTLADDGPAALRDDEAAQRHLEECDECFRMLEALSALDAGFEAMPRMDAPDDLVESLLEGLPPAPLEEHPRGEAASRSPKRPLAEAARHGARALFGPGHPRLKAAVAFALLAAVSLPLYLQVASQRAVAPVEYFSVMVVPPETEAGADEAGEGLAGDGEGMGGESFDYMASPAEANLSFSVTAASAQERLRALGYLSVDPEKLEKLKELQKPYEESLVVIPDPAPGSAAEDSPIDPGAGGRGQFEARYGTADAKDEGAEANASLDRDRTAESDLPIWVGGETGITYRGGSPRIEPDVPGPFDGDDDERQRVRDRLRERLQSLPRGLQDAPAPAEPDTSNQPDGDDEETPDDSKGGKGAALEPVEQLTVTAEAPAVEAREMARLTLIPDGKTPAADPVPADPAQEPARQSVLTDKESPAVNPSRELARRFLAERDAVDVAGRPADGYWTNTYVPGDPVMRYLQARLAGGDRSVLRPSGQAAAGGGPRLHDGARRITQPFDPPASAALAIQLHSDRSAISGETRMLMQVGLAGTPRRGGRRPAMNVALVLDLRGEIPAETGAGLVALAGAFAEARDLGDRFRLFAAGRGDGELVTPENLRRGSVVVATGNLLADESPTLGPTLLEAVHLAMVRVAEGDDPAAPLGSSAVIVATSQRLDTHAEAFAALAHQSAVAGIPLSVVGVGDAVDLGELDALALAGQGSRRLLRDASQATGLIDRELAAAGRAVARAVRLRLSLAPGVRLIDVVGARRHGSVGAEQVRQAEYALDQRLARNLGLKADRGDDEAGIQIVIPTFYAGDHHAILLDVVVPGPGPVADVTVRFKDLVQLENAVARDRLEVARGDGGRGPLERNVLKNLLAQRLRDVLDSAGRSVAGGERQAAVSLLDEHCQLLTGLSVEVPGLYQDPDVAGDVVMLGEYVQVLGGDGVETLEVSRYLADSLRYAARLKVLPAPMPVGGAE